MRKLQLVSSMLALLALVAVSSSALAAPTGFDQTASTPTIVASEPTSVGGYADGDIEVQAAQYYYPYGGYYPYYGYYPYTYPYYYGGYYPYYSSYYYPYYGGYYPYMRYPYYWY
jgi:hypothetical protein